MNNTFIQPLASLNRVGRMLDKRLRKLDLATTLDLVFYFPHRYEDFSEICDIENLIPGQQTTVRGQIELIKARRSWKRRMTLTEAVIRDQTGSIKAIWFNQPFTAKVLKAGDEIFLSGKTVANQYGCHFNNPIYEKVKIETAHTARIVPIYSLTEGITQKQVSFLMSQITPSTSLVIDWLPNDIISQYKLLPLSKALKQIHFPDSWASLEQAKRRLGFDELLTIILYNLKNKRDLNERQAINVPFSELKMREFVQKLPFQLTVAQKKCAWQIIKDMAGIKPMNRLLEGDVGSGKTIVAAIAMYNASLSGYESLLMAPTEILATQHYENLKKLFGAENVALVTRHHKKISSDRKIIVGTHALIQQKIKFNNLALAVVDEQHRFGVAQRKALQDKSGDPHTTLHLLSMTATPIPRTLALAVYGDLGLSIINEMPKGRKKIITRLVNESKRADAYNFIKKKIASGEQVFVICPLVNESDKLGVKSVEQEYERLKQEIFSEYKIAKLHGKLKPRDKELIMENFQNKKIDILVATSVVEVGVDIKNATIMMIEDADRFGLAQLHQFRGRVGRGDRQSYCLLFTSSKTANTIKRLNALVKSNDGFKLAEYDLNLRGPGDVYGKEQSGFISTLKVANLADHKLISSAKQAAEEIIDDISKFPLVQIKLNNFIKTIHLE
ncbi:MAG: ATP-dependent DNA helicase RecG [Patescibacteria group bacterium]